MPAKYSFPKLFSVAYGELLKNDPLRMAGATAFFTTFALPPILIIITQISGYIFKRRDVRRQLFEHLSGIVGTDSISQIAGVVDEMKALAGNWYITVGGFLFLIFVATTLFKIIKGSINQIWKIKQRAKMGVLANFAERVKSVLIILGAGFLFIIGILAESIQALLGSYIGKFSPFLAGYFNSFLNYMASLIIVTVWFALLFRFIPDGRPKWSVALAGGFCTSLFFMVGKILLHWLLGFSNIDTLYGASGSIVLLLLFVFYSSLILYYGAAFTKIWSEWKDRPISTRPHAMHYELLEVE